MYKVSVRDAGLRNAKLSRKCRSPPLLIIIQISLTHDPLLYFDGQSCDVYMEQRVVGILETVIIAQIQRKKSLRGNKETTSVIQ